MPRKFREVNEDPERRIENLPDSGLNSIYSTDEIDDSDILAFENVEQAINEQYGDIVSIGNALKVDDKNIVQKLLRHGDIDPFAKFDVFLVELEDANEGNSLYKFFAIGKNGKIRQIDMPIKEEGNKPLVVDPVSMKGPDGNNYTVRW